MSRVGRLKIKTELAFKHRALFAIELIDGVTMERVYRGIDILGVGLKNEPVVNHSGLFVWRPEDTSNLRRMEIVPVLRPFEAATVSAADMLALPPSRPLKSVELLPTIQYPFPSGVTGVVGRLVERSIPDATPIVGAKVQLQWLDENGHWHDACSFSQARIVSNTDSNGEFASVLRLPDAPEPMPVPGQHQVPVRLVIQFGNETRHTESRNIAFERIHESIVPWQDMTL